MYKINYQPTNLTPEFSDDWKLDLFPDILRVLNVAVMVQLADHRFMILGTPPKWLARLGRLESDNRISFDLAGSFMENFLKDVGNCWNQRAVDKVRSGMWTETDPEGGEQVFETAAVYWKNSNILLIHGVTEIYNGMHSILQRIRNSEAINDQLKRLAYFDDLTGLYNRRGFKLFAERRMMQAQLADESLLLFLIDLDGLKSINDNKGHEEGDQALIEMTKLLRHVFIDTHIIGRLGGDEFVVLTKNSGPSHADQYVACLQHASRIWNLKPDRNFRLSFSIGVAAYDGDEPCLHDLLAEADQKMYLEKKNKRSGRR